VSRRARALGVLVLVVTLGACHARRVRPVDNGPLDGGKERIYALVDSGTLAAADALLDDVWDLGPRTTPARLAPVTWTEDPDHDAYWRFLFYSLRPTSNLLWAYYRTGDGRYRDKLLGLLASFVAYDQTRSPLYDRLGLDNPHTAAFRAMVLVNTTIKLGRSGDLPPPLARDLRATIHKLGLFLADVENFEGQYNHGFTEAAALLVIAANFPDFAEAGDWQALGVARLHQLMAYAIDDDGVEVENSPFYHYYVLTFTTEIERWARQYAVPLASDYTARRLSMLRYATLIPQPDGALPLLGATVALDVRSYEPDLYAALGQLDPELEWVRTGGHGGRAPSERSALFPVSGQAVLRSGFGAPGELEQATHLTFNTGAYRTHHSHFDILGITYSSSGRTLLPDSGLFTYDQDNMSEEHRYFFGTLGHNTVVVDGQDQDKHALARSGLSAAGDGWAYQSGEYSFAGVSHRRAVVLIARDLALVVDFLDAPQAHAFTQTWHLFAGATLQMGPALDVTAVADGAPRLTLGQALRDGVTVSSTIGATHPLQGWYSDAYGVKTPAYAVEYATSGATVQLVSLIASGAEAGGLASVTASADDQGGAHATVCARSGGYAIDIVNAAAGAPSESVTVGAAPAGACAR
jgi:hypothetical protein